MKSIELIIINGAHFNNSLLQILFSIKGSYLGLPENDNVVRAIASDQINPFSGPRFSIDWKKKFASVLVRGSNLGGFEYDRFPINKDSRDNGARSSTWKARNEGGREDGRG